MLGAGRLAIAEGSSERSRNPSPLLIDSEYANGSSAEEKMTDSTRSSQSNTTPDSAFGAEWTSFTPAESGCSVLFPGAPSTQTGEHDIYGFDVKYHIFTVRLATGEFIASYGEFPMEMAEAEVEGLGDGERYGL